MASLIALFLIELVWRDGQTNLRRPRFKEESVEGLLLNGFQLY